MLKNMISSYDIKTRDDYFNALREVFQELALAGLYRAGFFKHAAFYGGTALRIFYDLDRFSEDLDFSLLSVNPDFSLEPYFKILKQEFESFGIDIEISNKQKQLKSKIESAFLKSNTDIYTILLDTHDFKNNISQKQLKIKFEVDTNPPLDFETQNKLLLKPFSFYVNCFSKGDLYAGKVHALLFRKWKNRVKGRDWYDFEWYIRYGFKLNLKHLNSRINQSEGLKRENITKELLIDMLKEKIQTVDFQIAKDDIKQFIKDKNKLDIWSKEYFIELLKEIKFK